MDKLKWTFVGQTKLTNHNCPIFRIGGDEFVAIMERVDYEHREEIFSAFDKLMNYYAENGDMSIAFGYSCFDPKTDKSIKAVVERADSNMYKHKKLLKSKRKK